MVAVSVIARRLSPLRETVYLGANGITNVIELRNKGKGAEARVPSAALPSHSVPSVAGHSCLQFWTSTRVRGRPEQTQSLIVACL
jgi:hypothetical protein